MRTSTKRLIGDLVVLAAAGPLALGLICGAIWIQDRDQVSPEWVHWSAAYAASCVVVGIVWLLLHVHDVWEGIGSDLPEPIARTVKRQAIAGVGAVALTCVAYAGIAYATTKAATEAEVPQKPKTRAPSGADAPPVAALATANVVLVDRRGAGLVSTARPGLPCHAKRFLRNQYTALAGYWRMAAHLQLFHETNEEGLSDLQKRALRQFVFDLIDAADGVVRVRSHVDAQGTEAKNQQLALRRVQWTGRTMLCLLDQAGLVTPAPGSSDCGAVLSDSASEAVKSKIDAIVKGAMIQRFPPIVEPVAFNEAAGPEPSSSGGEAANYRNRSSVVEYFERCTPDRSTAHVTVEGRP
ncbi:MAG: hypothetical protein AB7K86_04265 [Rhodospirillales bacterium]